jgi:cysteinyl-tRNA synthetase
MRALGGLLGLLQSDPSAYLQSPTRYQSGASGQASLDNARIEALIVERADAKKARDFARADQIRAMLRESGIELEDKPNGATQWRRA